MYNIDLTEQLLKCIFSKKNLKLLKKFLIIFLREDISATKKPLDFSRGFFVWFLNPFTKDCFNRLTISVLNISMLQNLD